MGVRAFQLVKNAAKAAFFIIFSQQLEEAAQAIFFQSSRKVPVSTIYKAKIALKSRQESTSGVSVFPSI